MKEHYILQFPFTSAAGNNIDTLQLRRLKVKDMRNARRISEKPEEWDEPLMAAMTGLVPEDLAEMDLLDYQALQKRFQSMLTVVTESSLLWQAMALLARWFRFPPSEIDALTVDDFSNWLDEASAQIKIEYDSQT